ncbi:MAG: arginine decarboxylase, pyruvoyl-dependent [Thermoplasmata archaeon]|nr:arginine decarboxylase, pyruvoyl-dependent [Thermoplasmata archaeon]
MSLLLPKKVFFTSGVGTHREQLNSFELALRDAGIEKYNLVSVSSILPPHCDIISRAKGLKMIQPGSVVHTVMSKNSSKEANRLISTAIGCAIPLDRERYGYISEHHDFGVTKKDAGEYAEDLAAEMLASTLGIPFDVDASYDMKREIFKIDGRIVKTRHVAESARCKSSEKWTTVIAAAVFIMD